MRWRVAASAILMVFSATPMHAQAATPLGALEEMVTTKDVDVVLRHLPRAIRDTFDELSPRAKQEALDHLVTAKNLEREGLELRRGGNGVSWEVVKVADGEVERTVEVSESFIVGDRALLTFRMVGNAENPERGEATVTMVLDDGEWRLTEFGHLERRSLQEALKQKFDHNEASQQEGFAAVSRMTWALKRYAAMFPAVGFPSTLDVLGCGGEEPSAEHACLMHAVSGNVTQTGGYHITYAPEDHGRFQVIAVPNEWGDSGRKSFFADQSGVIRSTTEKRNATVDDEEESAVEVDE